MSAGTGPGPGERELALDDGVLASMEVHSSFEYAGHGHPIDYSVTITGPGWKLKVDHVQVDWKSVGNGVKVMVDERGRRRVINRD